MKKVIDEFKLSFPVNIWEKMFMNFSWIFIVTTEVFLQIFLNSVGQNSLMNIGLF